MGRVKPLAGGQLVIPDFSPGYARILDSALQPLAATTSGAVPLLMKPGASISDRPAAGRSYVTAMSGTHMRVSAIDAGLGFVAGFGDQGSGTTDIDLALPLSGLVVPAGNTASVTAMRTVATGQHVLVGATVTYGSTLVPVGHIVLRLNPDGSFDRDFGNGGFIVLNKSALLGSMSDFAERSDGLLWLSQQGAILRLQTRALRSSGVLGFPQLQLSSVQAEASTVSIRVQRALGSNGAVSLRYRTVDGTLTAGTDYVAATGTLTWDDGDEADKTLAIQVLAGRANGSFSVSLEQPTNGAVLGLTSATVQRYIASGTASNAAASNATSTIATSGGGGGAFSGLPLLILMMMSLDALWRRGRVVWTARRVPHRRATAG